jgi:Amt family ammonium transporter
MRCFAARISAAIALFPLLAVAAFAQNADAPETAQATAVLPDPGNTAWMMISTILVLMMTVPGLALFYGGLVRAKNALSVLMQVMMIASVVMIVWVVYGYSMAFGDAANAYWGGLGKASSPA